MSERKSELRTFLKSRRQRLTPEQCGLPSGNRRRIRTLRREDVATLADVGITWYTWLEQGRPIKMADETLKRIASALRLDESETAYLAKLVHLRSQPATCWSTPIDEHIAAFVERYMGGWASVLGPRLDLLGWNRAFADFFGFNGIRRSDAFDRNLLWIMIADERMRVRFPKRERLARSLIATFRFEYADYVGDLGFENLIDALACTSPEFVSMWSDVDVLSPLCWDIGEVRDVGRERVIPVETVTLPVPDAPGQTLLFYFPCN